MAAPPLLLKTARSFEDYMSNMHQQTAKVVVIRGFIKAPGQLAEVGDELLLPLSIARERVAAGQCDYVPMTAPSGYQPQAPHVELQPDKETRATTRNK